MRAAVLSALLVPVFLTGCSTYVTVVSEPEGAVITDASGSIVYGRAPLDVEYDTNELRHGAHPGQCAQIPGFTARWPSGASASTDAALPLCDLRHGMTVRINRPKSAPGLDAEIERARMMLYMDHGWFWGPGWGPWPRTAPPPPRPVR